MQFRMLLVLFFIILCGHSTIVADDKSYSVEIDNFEVSTAYDQKYVKWDTLGLKKVGRNKYVISGTVQLNRNLADDQKINIQAFPYHKEKQIKGPLIFNMEKPICKFVATDEDIYPGLKEKSNIPDRGTCPIPKDDYTIDDYEVNVDFLRNDVPRGDYLLVVLLKDGLSPVAGFSATVTIED